MVMADSVKMDVPETSISARVYLKDVSKEKLQLIPAFEGVVIDKDNLDAAGKAERENMQTLFGKAVEKSSGTNTRKEIEENGVKELNLTEYTELLST